MKIYIQYGESLGVTMDVEPEELAEVAKTLFAGMANVAQNQAVRQNIMSELAKRQSAVTKNDKPTEA